MKFKNYTQEEVRLQIAEYLKDCSEEDFKKVVEICFKWRGPEFTKERDEKGFRFINMLE
jgi:hypothetical protein